MTVTLVDVIYIPHVHIPHWATKSLLAYVCLLKLSQMHKVLEIYSISRLKKCYICMFSFANWQKENLALQETVTNVTLH